MRRCPPSSVERAIVQVRLDPFLFFTEFTDRHECITCNSTMNSASRFLGVPKLKWVSLLFYGFLYTFSIFRLVSIDHAFPLRCSLQKTDYTNHTFSQDGKLSQLIVEILVSFHSPFDVPIRTLVLLTARSCFLSQGKLNAYHGFNREASPWSSGVSRCLWVGDQSS